MNTGDIVTDVHQRTWTIGQPLGVGTWGRTWRVTNENGVELVLKVPLRPEDFPAGAALPEGLSAACRAAAREAAALLRSAPHPFLPRFEGTVPLPDRGVGLLMPRYPSTLAQRLATAADLTDVLGILARVARVLADARQVHGNLRPTNILLADGDTPVLPDMLTPTLRDWGPRLRSIWTTTGRYLPPEADDGPVGCWDTWALCAMLYEAATAEPGSADAIYGTDLHGGLDKVELAAVRDHAMARLAAEGTNERFRAPLAAKLSAVLSRGLSEQTAPSPPYRFLGTAALLPRLEQLVSLVDPSVTDVGRVNLAADAKAGVFQLDGTVAFSISVASSEGVRDADDLVTGLQLRDLDGEGDGRIPLPDARFDVRKHPSGRLRFGFTLPGLPPGRYEVRAAFGLKGSSTPPKATNGRFEVRPPPGWVPPPVEDDGPAPIRFDGRGRSSTAPLPAPPPPRTAPRAAPRAASLPTPMAPRAPAPRASMPGLAPRAAVMSAPMATASTDVTASGAELITGVFPRPIAPPTESETGAPLPMPRSSALPRPAEVPDPSDHAENEPTALPSIPLPIPSIALAVGSSAATNPYDAPLPRALAAAPAPAPSVEAELDDWSGPGVWEALPSPARDDGALDALPLPASDTEDLPSWDAGGFSAGTRVSKQLEAMMEILKRDAYTSFVGAMAVSLILLLLAAAMMRACA